MLGSRSKVAILLPPMALFIACLTPVDEDRCATIAGACPPKIRSISPDQGDVDGGTAVVIAGGPFTPATRAFFQQPVQSRSTEATVTLVTADELRVVTPPGLEGPADVAVTDAWNVTVAEGAFFYGRRPSLDAGSVLDGGPVTDGGQ
jgi:hypothetical protein